MLTCPFCQFENTESHQSCQQCGQSLQIWYVLCLPKPTTHDSGVIGPFLDSKQRYRLPQAAISLPAAQPLALRVVDMQPTEPSPLSDLQQAWLENPQLEPQHSPLAQSLPAQAVPYLALQGDYFPAVPEIHDAFHLDSHNILLIEDRTSWGSLQSRWLQQDEHPWQRIQWLFEMALLWEALTPWGLEATLLHGDSLAINPNDLLCLTQLVPTPAHTAATLEDLGEFWQRFLLDGNPQPVAPALAQLVQHLTLGKMSTIEQLKIALAHLAEEAPDCSPDCRTREAAHASGSSSASHRPTVPSLAFEGANGQPDVPPVLTDEALLHIAASQADLDLLEEPPDERNEAPEIPTMVLPMKLIQVDEVGQTHVGMQRNHNEDCFFAQTASIKVDSVNGTTLKSKGLYIVCDGMGGHASGEVASHLAVNTLKNFFEEYWKQDLPDEATLAKSVIVANQAIYDINQANATSGLGRMGTTLVMLLVQDLKAVAVHVGDSRLYSYCKRLGLRQLTLDHEVGQREINRGIEPSLAYARADAYQLTQALGPRGQHEVKPSITYFDIAEDTLFVLCSDGLSDNDLLERHENSHIAPMLSSRTNLEAGLAELIDLANEKNGHDNITAVVTRLKLRPDMANLPR